MKVAILGASAKPERYAYRALEQLLEKEHEVYPVHPKLQFVKGQRVYNSLADIKDKIETLTLYVGPARTNEMIDEIIALNPERIIFNPGAENDKLRDKAEAAGIKTMYACTLVLLSTNQF